MKHTLRDRGEKVRNIVEECINFNEEEDSQDGLVDENGDNTIDYGWKEQVITHKTEEILKLISSLRSDLLQQVIDRLPRIEHVYKCVGEYDFCETCSHNKALDKVTSLLNKMRDEK